MAKRKDTIIEAIRVGDGDAGRVVGQSLKSLREAAGLTQCQMAQRLNVGQAAISKIEHRGDVQISSLQRYVEALGAKLRIDAVFPVDTDFLSNFAYASNYQASIEDQYVLPLFAEESAPTKRDVALSINPEYVKKILEGRKTVELRRRFPTTPKGTTAYIYCTSPVQAMVGSAEITEVVKLNIPDLWRYYANAALIKRRDFDTYFQGLEEGFALKIASVRPLSRPLNLVELRERFGFKAPQSFLYAKPNLQRALQ
jgi:predicted transcriptional regulator/DNA-binding XRE family transcriptional regulator